MRKDARISSVMGSKVVLLDGFHSDFILFLYARSAKKERIFKDSIEHGLKNGELCIYALSEHTKLKSYFKAYISSGMLHIYQMREGIKGLCKLLEDCCDIISSSKEYIALRFLFDFSAIDNFDKVLEIKKVVIDKREKSFPISGIFAFDITNLNAEMTRALMEGVPRVIISAEEETTISFTTASYPAAKSVDVIPQDMVEQIVRKSVEPIVLLSLRDNPMSGYDILKEISDKFHVLLPQARVYSLLYDLETRGIINSIVKGKSKIYSPTEAGKKHIEEKLKDFYAVYAHILGLER